MSGTLGRGMTILTGSMPTTFVSPVSPRSTTVRSRYSECMTIIRVTASRSALLMVRPPDADSGLRTRSQSGSAARNPVCSWVGRSSAPARSERWPLGPVYESRALVRDRSREQRSARSVCHRVFRRIKDRDHHGLPRRWPRRGTSRDRAAAAPVLSAARLPDPLLASAYAAGIPCTTGQDAV